ncbi:ABC transporter substrate-binding protein [Natrarchaeobaculum aegyptiacum]|nr:ABC transporter substrate-binding protein [Natrarchaeobaculum aegyptiacum]
MRGNATQRIGRRTFVGMAGAGITASLAGCAGGSNGDGPGDDGLSIGLLAYEPGAAPMGTAQENAAELAVQELNDEGGVLGEDVQLDVANYQGSASTASDRYLEFVVEDDVDITAGVFQTEVMVDLMSEIASHQTIHMSGGHTSPVISEMVADNYDDYRYQFRPYGNAVHWMHSIADMCGYMQDQEGWERIALLNEEFEWTQTFTDDLPDELEDLGLEVVFNDRYPADTEDFSPLFDSIEAEDADATLMGMAHTAGPALLQWQEQEREFVIGGQIAQIVNPAAYGDFDGTIEFAMSNAPAVHTAELTDETIPFAERYYDEFGIYPNDDFAYATYDGIKMWAEVVEELGTADTEDVIEGLLDASYEGTRGVVEFQGENDEFPHDARFGEGYLERINFQWQEDDGEGIQNVVHPDHHATADYQEPDWY